MGVQTFSADVSPATDWRVGRGHSARDDGAALWRAGHDPRGVHAAEAAARSAAQLLRARSQQSPPKQQKWRLRCRNLKKYI